MQFRTQLGAGLLLLVALSRPVFPQDAKTAYATPEDAAANPDFALQGEYANDRLGIQVVALGDDEFEVVTFRGGLPGAGWNGKDRQSSEEDGEAVRELIEDLELEKVHRTSPTIGAEPPRGAVVLFDGTEQSLKEHWQDGARMTDDGLLMEGVTSRDTFRDFSLHIEFRLPFMPYARGQARGNSGIYYQGRYETQMLDSFGLEGKDNETGGIYEIRDPDLNMCLPPLTCRPTMSTSPRPATTTRGTRPRTRRSPCGSTASSFIVTSRSPVSPGPHRSRSRPSRGPSICRTTATRSVTATSGCSPATRKRKPAGRSCPASNGSTARPAATMPPGDGCSLVNSAA